MRKILNLLKQKCDHSRVKRTERKGIEDKCDCCGKILMMSEECDVQFRIERNEVFNETK